MPIVILALIVIVGSVAYYFFVSNSSLYTSKRPKKNDPFNVIYLPEDLEAEKEKRRKQAENKQDENE